jgi:hypothetical protein
LFRAHAIESFDSAVVRSRTASGVQLWFGASHASHETIEPEIVITGDRGQACWRYESEAFWQPTGGAKVSRRLLDITGARRAMFAVALQRLHNPAVRICPTELAARHTALIESIHHQAQIGTVPATLVTWAGANGLTSEVPAIRGLTTALQKAYSNGQSLAVTGFAPGP